SAYSPPEIAGLRLLPALGQLRWLGQRAQVAQVPVAEGRLLVVTTAFVERVHAAGSQVHVWTVNDGQEMRRLLDLGVDGIMSDRLELLRSVLQERGAWPAGAE
ncbi:MAG: glycerophosphodiester phosphodiesterase family protein, partial [Sciscionella sp.]